MVANFWKGRIFSGAGRTLEEGCGSGNRLLEVRSCINPSGTTFPLDAAALVTGAGPPLA